MSWAKSWQNVSKGKRTCIFLLLGTATVLAFALATMFTSDSVDGSVGQGTIFSVCSDFFPVDPLNTANFTFGGVNCEICQPIGSEIVFTGCENDCTQWVYETLPSIFSPIAATCDTNFAPTPSPPPGSEIVCPVGFYSTQQQTGCDADTLEGIIALSEASLLLEDEPTLDECFAACENPQLFCDTCDENDKCSGVIIGADGESCFAFLETAEPFCGVEKEGQVTCKPIQPNFQCFTQPVSFSQAKSNCNQIQGGSLVKRPNPDEQNIQFARISKACVESGASQGCYFDTDTEFCFFVQPDGNLGQDADCNDQRGFCCEIETSAPTVSPTASPTNTLFFVPDCGLGVPEEMSFDEARSCCLQQNADLATIISNEEQDLAYAKCAEALSEFENDCGCWLGLNRIDEPPSIDPLDFSWIDGTLSAYENWEDFPLPQPNNLDDRNEECVHMRPFTLGGWNDLPCLGNCDARDTKPFPLCRTYTPAPTTSPTQSPTRAPSKVPTFSPSRRPTDSPTFSPTGPHPTTHPSIGPTPKPTPRPTKKPTAFPTPSPTPKPTKKPTVSPTPSPVKTPCRPDPVCVYGDGEEYIFRFCNDQSYTVHFRFSFKNPNKGFLPGDEPFYPKCFFRYCFSYTFTVHPGECVEFRAPVPKIWVECSCKHNKHKACEKVEVIAPPNLPQCSCPLFEFFEDDFEQYPGIEAISPADSQLFFERWSVFDGTVDIKGVITDENNVPILDENGELEFVSHFFFNPCHKGLKCVDIDGTVEINFLESNTQAIRPIEIPPSDAFFNRICTLNFFTRGNGRCGKLHKDEDPPIVNEGQAKLNDRCFEFYPAENVPLFDNLTVAIAENGNELLSVLFEDIRWDTPFFPAGLTADIENEATNVSGSFTVFGGEFLETGLNIGPLLDDVDLTCCCPDPEDRFIHRVLEFDQGLTGDGHPCPNGRSDERELINRDPWDDSRRVVSLGLKGSILLEFRLGASGFIYIFEETFGCRRGGGGGGGSGCGGGGNHNSNTFDPDDAMVEVSVDGIIFVTVADSLRNLEFDLFRGYHRSIRRFRVDLPNGACFKFVRITDISESDSHASDGFDLVAVEVKKPCCPTIRPPYITQAPTGHDQIAFGLPTDFSINVVNASLAGVGMLGLVSLAVLTALSLVNTSTLRRVSKVIDINDIEDIPPPDPIVPMREAMQKWEAKMKV